MSYNVDAKKHHQQREGGHSDRASLQKAGYAPRSRGRRLSAQHHGADVVASSFIARYDADACTGCQTCLDRCQMDALSANGEGIVFDDRRCIGCGLCVSTCPSGALTLERKPGSEDILLPIDMVETWRAVRDMQARRG